MPVACLKKRPLFRVEFPAALLFVGQPFQAILNHHQIRQDQLLIQLGEIIVGRGRLKTILLEIAHYMNQCVTAPNSGPGRLLPFVF